MLKKPYYFSILILFFIGCKSTELVKPSIISNANARDSEYNDEMLSQSNHLVHIFAKLTENDSIKTEIVMLAGRGLGNYFWVPLQKLSQNLADKYGIVLSEEANRFLVNYYGLDPTIDH